MSPHFRFSIYFVSLAHSDFRRTTTMATTKKAHGETYKQEKEKEKEREKEKEKEREKERKRQQSRNWQHTQ